jgi:PKD repeat protein
VGQQVSFNASDSSSPDPIVAYDWDFGDTGGTSTNGPTVNHPYSAANTYTVRLTIRDSAGRQATTTKTVTVVP